jgi:DNA helicase-2/ATP-dependent DNA helicase PcrA
LKGVANIIASRISDGVDPTDIAVITRTRAKNWANWLKPHLDPHGISLAWTGWVQDALNEHEVRRWLARAHLRLLRDDSLAWWTLMHTENGIGPSFIDYVYDRVATDETFGAALLRLHDAGFPDLNRGRTQVQLLITTTLEAVDAMDDSVFVFDDRGWGGWILNEINVSPISDDARRLFEMVGQAIPATEGLAGFLSQLEPVGKDLAAAEGQGVRVMTMNSSKGLTVNTALVLGVEEGIVPLIRDGIDEAEERRLLYVAMTRATDMCVLTYAQHRSGPSARIGATNVGTRNRSPFLASLPGRAGDAEVGSAWVERLLAK